MAGGALSSLVVVRRNLDLYPIVLKIENLNNDSPLLQSFY